LLFAARQGDLESARILVDAGANVNDSAPAGLSALVVAAHSGHGEVAGFLLEKGADPNAADAGYTALHAAVLRGDGRLVKQLLAHKANVSTPVAKSTPNRRASPDYVLNKAQVGATPLWLSAHFLEPDIMKALVAGGADPLFTKDKATALMAVIRSSPRRGGISLDPRDEERRTLEAISFLVQLGVDVNAANPAGDTVMHMAAAGRKSNAVIQRLVDSGARLDVKNKKEQTPLAIATTPLPRSLGSPAPKEGLDDAGARVADLLRKLGAKE
jgi:ankyrin repeat protein